jgi:hypothetical protein
VGLWVGWEDSIRPLLCLVIVLWQVGLESTVHKIMTRCIKGVINPSIGAFCRLSSNHTCCGVAWEVHLMHLGSRHYHHMYIVANCLPLVLLVMVLLRVDLCLLHLRLLSDLLREWSFTTFTT